MNNELEYIPTNDQLEEQRIGDPIAIETEIKRLEHEVFVMMQEVYPLKHQIDQLKHDLSIANKEYWKGRGK